MARALVALAAVVLVALGALGAPMTPAHGQGLFGHTMGDDGWKDVVGARTLVFSDGESPGGVLNVVDTLGVGGRRYAVAVLPWDYGSFLPGESKGAVDRLFVAVTLAVSKDGIDDADEARSNWIVFDAFRKIGVLEASPKTLYTVEEDGVMSRVGSLTFRSENNYVYIDIPTKLLFVFLGDTGGLDLGAYALPRGRAVTAADPDLRLGGIVDPKGFGDVLPRPYRPSADRGAAFMLGPTTETMRCGRVLWRIPGTGADPEAVAVTNGGIAGQILFTNLTRPLFDHRLRKIEEKFRRHVD